MTEGAGRLTQESPRKDDAPSMWEYDGRRLPKEFVNVDLTTFAVDRSRPNLVHLPKEVLTAICKCLSVIDFIDLSLTCRYLHWRMFAFCTCYAPYSVRLTIRDRKVDYYYGRGEEVSRLYEADTSKTVYSCRVEEADRRRYPVMIQEEGDRVVVARHPSCLRRPFFFDKLVALLKMPFFKKDDFDRCLPYIEAARRYARLVEIGLTCTNPAPLVHEYDYAALNDFLEEVKPETCSVYDPQDPVYILNLWLFDKCAYFRTMPKLRVCFYGDDPQYENLALLNAHGLYFNTPLSAIIQTIKEFRFGTHELIEHEYELDWTHLLAFEEHILNNYPQIVEYCKETTSRNGRKRHVKVRIATVDTVETERRHTMTIYSGRKTIIKFKKYDEEWLEEFKSRGNMWKMETAVEPED